MQGETAERILDAANTLLIDRGYSAFSYADIAEVVINGLLRARPGGKVTPQDGTIAAPANP